MCSSSATSVSSSLLVRRCPHHRWVSDGLVGPSSLPRHCVLGPSRVLQATDGFVLSGRSSAALHNGCAIPCCQHLFALVVWVVIAVGGGLMWVCFCCASASRYCDAVLFLSPSPPFEQLVLVLVRIFFMCPRVCVCVCVCVCVPVTELNLRSCDGTVLKQGSFKQGVLALLAILLHSELYVSPSNRFFVE